MSHPSDELLQCAFAMLPLCLSLLLAFSLLLFYFRHVLQTLHDSQRYFSSRIEFLGKLCRTISRLKQLAVRSEIRLPSKRGECADHSVLVHLMIASFPSVVEDYNGPFDSDSVRKGTGTSIDPVKKQCWK